MNNKKLNIVVLLGGTSPEREVSKSSGKSVYRALKSLGHNVKLVDPAYGTHQPDNEDAYFAKEDFGPVSNLNYIRAINSELFDGVDLVFLALHGKYGEDGTIQSLLELRGIKYTGSGILASSLGMDKAMTKVMFRHFGVTTPEWLTVSRAEALEPGFVEQIAGQIGEQFGYPCIIKPNDQGSTIGLTVCGSPAEVGEAVRLAHTLSDKALIEEFIPGHEIGVTILDNQALPVLEIKPLHQHYDYECKYTHGMSEYIVPAQLPEEVSRVLQQEALLAFKAVDCRGYARLDFRVTENYEIYCLEVNTLPGMTDTSLVPKMAKAAGISFEELLEKIIALAIQ